MKNITLILIILLLVGCQKNQEDKLICNYKNEKREDIVTIYFKNNESLRYQKKSTIIFDNSIQASNYRIDENYDRLEVVDNEVSMYIDENIDDMTKDEVISLYESYGYICN